MSPPISSCQGIARQDCGISRAATINMAAHRLVSLRDFPEVIWLRTGDVSVRHCRASHKKWYFHYAYCGCASLCLGDSLGL